MPARLSWSRLHGPASRRRACGCAGRLATHAPLAPTRSRAAREWLPAWVISFLRVHGKWFSFSEQSRKPHFDRAQLGRKAGGTLEKRLVSDHFSGLSLFGAIHQIAGAARYSPLDLRGR